MTVKVWGDYEVHFDEVLGRGGMGAVYKGRQVSVNRPVAVKILKRDLTESPDFVRRFHREASLLARVVDSHIVQVYGAGEAEGQHFYAMELVEGEDLSTRIRRGYQFTPEEILQVAVQTASGLKAAWKEKIIHRDIKPSNIIVTNDNLVKVMDFGLAKNPENDLTQTEMIMGTAKYMSPEQATGQACDIRSDLYSLGAVLYELATGTAPFVGESPTAVIYQHVHKMPVLPQKLNPSLPNSLQMVIMRLLSKTPAERYQTPDEMIRDCKAILDGVSIDEKTALYAETAIREEEAAEKKEAEEKTSRIGLYVSLVIAIGILGGAGWLVAKALRNPGEPPVTSDGKKKTPGRPEWELRYEQAVTDAKNAFDARQWATAQLEYRKALEALPEGDERRGEVTTRLNLARYREICEDLAPKETSLRNRIMLYEEALGLASDGQERKRAKELLSAARVEKAVGDAREAVATKNWTNAAAAYREAAKEDPPERAQFEKQAEFFTALDRVQKYENLDETKKEIERLLQGETYGQTEELQRHLAEVNKRIEQREKDAEAQREKAYRAMVAQIREKTAAGAWAEADKIAQEADAEPYRKYHDDEFAGFRKTLKRALHPPEGMVYVPAGPYPIGADGEEHAPPKADHPLEAYYIDAAPVTAKEYEEFIAALKGTFHLPTCHSDEKSKGKGSHIPRNFDRQKPDAPVRDVDWWDAYAYAAWRGKRLPTEFEFEVAGSYDLSARKKRRYPWGDALGEGPSAFGLRGLDDDLIEWTSSRYVAYPWSSATSTMFTKGYYVLRGGYKDKQKREAELRAVQRFFEPPEKTGYIGFRCARSVAADE